MSIGTDIESLKKIRPVVYNYGSIPDFLNDLLKYHKSNSSFSLRQRSAKVENFSQTLISLILQGKRQLKRDHLPSIAEIFKLTQLEQQYLDKKLSAQIHKIDFIEDTPAEGKVRVAKNHLLSDWLNPYVKDLIHLKGFRLDAEVLFSMLQGIAPAPKIKRSVEFLLKEGFWRKSPDGKIVPEEHLVTTTNEVPNEKIRAVHKKALALAIWGIDALPINSRKASTVLISVDDEKLDELRGLVDSFHKQLLDFVEKNPTGSDKLVQVAIHLTQIGKNNV